MLNLQAHDWKDKVSVLARDWHVLWKASPLLTVKVQSWAFDSEVVGGGYWRTWTEPLPGLLIACFSLSDFISWYIRSSQGVCQLSVSYTKMELLDWPSKYCCFNRRYLVASCCSISLFLSYSGPNCLCVKSEFVVWKWTSSTGRRCFLPSRSSVWKCEVNTEHFGNMTRAKTTAPLCEQSVGPVVMLCASFFICFHLGRWGDPLKSLTSFSQKCIVRACFNSSLIYLSK